MPDLEPGEGSLSPPNRMFFGEKFKISLDPPNNYILGEIWPVCLPTKEVDSYDGTKATVNYLASLS